MEESEFDLLSDWSRVSSSSQSNFNTPAYNRSKDATNHRWKNSFYDNTDCEKNYASGLIDSYTSRHSFSVINSADLKDGLFIEEEKKEMDAEKLFDILRQDRDESEKRLNKNMERLEDRIIKATEASEEREFQRAERIECQINKLAQKMDDTKKWVIGIALTTILGIAAMVITVIISTPK